MKEFLIFLIGVGFGVLLISWLTTFQIEREKKKILKENNRFFSDIYNSLKNSGKFVSRVNNNIEISIVINGVTHSLIYLLDKSEVALFLGKDCLKFSDGQIVDREIVMKIISEINTKWGKKISSVVNMNGSIIDSATYKRITANFNFDVEDKPKIEISLNLDEILDKINEIGFENLSKQEKEFLKKFK